jgi:hypothetical protein
MVISAFTLFCIIRKMSIPRSAYLRICALVFVYLIIGFIYNLSVFELWKTYFFDFKVFLCLTIPYLFLYTSTNSIIGRWFTVKRIFVYSIIAGTLDLLVAWIFFGHFLGIPIPYPQYLGFPTMVPQILPAHVAMIGILFSVKIKYKFAFFVLALVNIVSCINTLSIGYLSILPFFLFLVIVLLLKVNTLMKAWLILASIVVLNVSLVFLMTNPFHLDLLTMKSEGATTRKVQLDNALLNFNQNIPGIIGKGWGSTWFEYIPVPEQDVFSVGTSVATESEEAMAMPVKFIFNWMPPALLHKWGAMGVILLSLLLARFYENLANRIRELKRNGLRKGMSKYLYAILIIAFCYVISDFMWNTTLAGSVFTSVLVFSVESEIKRTFRSLSIPTTYRASKDAAIWSGRDYFNGRNT